MGARRVVRALQRPRPLARAVAEFGNAVNGFRPLSRAGYSTMPVFCLGWPTSELPLLCIGASTLSTARRARRGDFAGGPGAAALALTAASWAVLAIIARRNMATPGPVLRRALREGLGAGYQQVLAALPTAAGDSGRLSVWRTTWARRRFVDQDGVVRYGPHGRANLADVWRRSDLPRTGNAPVLLQIPGGGWTLGWRRTQAYPLMARMVEGGWICVSMNYRVSPMHTWPAHIVDVKRALAWVKENIADFGGDPDFVAVTGGSAGGHLASLAALTPNDPVYQPGFEDADTSVAAAVPMYGRYDWLATEGTNRRELMAYLAKFVVKKDPRRHQAVFRAASPIERLSADAPPFFVLHGEHDSLIPVEEAREFVAALAAVSSSPVAYAELPGAQHAFDIFSSARAHHCARAVATFLNWVYAGTHRR